MRPRRLLSSGPPRPRAPSSIRAELGRSSEEAAWKHLESLGWQLLARNYRWRGGEIDIIARDGKVLVFVEVRARSHERCGRAEESVSALKQSRLRRTALHFLAQHPFSGELRFDVLSFQGESWRHDRNAF